RLVDESGALEAGNPALANVGDCKVSMQGLFIDQRLAGIIASLELHFEFRTDRNAKPQLESVEPKTASDIVGQQNQSDFDFSIVPQTRSFNLPFHTARKTVRRPGFPIASSAEPREDHRYAAANGFTSCVQALRAYEKNGTLSVRSPLAEVCSLQVEFRFRLGRVNYRTRQTRGCLLDTDRVWNLEWISHLYPLY